MIKILERLDQEKGFEFERAYVAVDMGFAYAVGIFGGVPCHIETKSKLLDAGIASCNPLDSFPNWPLSLRVEADGQSMMLNEVTADEKAVAAARKFRDLLASGDIAKIKDGTPL